VFRINGEPYAFGGLTDAFLTRLHLEGRMKQLVKECTLSRALRSDNSDEMVVTLEVFEFRTLYYIQRLNSVSMTYVLKL
jgi:hypothetical protein